MGQFFRNHITEEQLLGCMRCGFCLPTCPTYSVTGNESDSPRGRMALTRFAQTGKLPITSGLNSHLYDCLLCKACASVCPAGVPVDDLVMEAREVLNHHQKPSPIKQFLFHHFLQETAWMERAAVPMRLIQRLGLPALGQLTGISKLLPNHLGELEPLLPKLPLRPARKILPTVIPAKGTRKYRVGYFLSCLDNIAFHESAQALIHVLTGAGCEVIIPKDLNCCGMPHRAYGEIDAAREVARKNLNALTRESFDAIITDCATCGSALKEYRHLFKDQPEYEQADQLSSKVMDITEWLSQIEWKPSRKLDRKIKLTYHQPCHLGRAQKIVDQPRNLLKSIDEIEWIEMKEADWCCGGAGSYNQTHFEYSMKILERKMGNIAATRAEFVAAGCPSCQMQLGLGAHRMGLAVGVVHPILMLHMATTE